MRSSQAAPSETDARLCGLIETVLLPPPHGFSLYLLSRSTRGSPLGQVSCESPREPNLEARHPSPVSSYGLASPYSAVPALFYLRYGQGASECRLGDEPRGFLHVQGSCQHLLVYRTERLLQPGRQQVHFGQI